MHDMMMMQVNEMVVRIDTEKTARCSNQGPQGACQGLGSAEPAPSSRPARSTKRIDDDTGSRTSHRRRVAAKHRHTRPEFGATQRDHVLADMNGDLLSLMMVGVYQYPLD